MAENTFEVDYELNASQARDELEKVRKQLSGLTADFNHNLETSKKGIVELTTLLKAMVGATEAGSAARARAERSATSILGARYQRLSQGSNETASQANQLNRAASQALINDIQNTAKAAEARVTDAIVKQTVNLLRTTEQAVAARIKSATFANSQSVANSDDRYLAARNTLANQRRSDTIFAGENGRAALASRNRLEQLNYNGGADLMGIQGRVMLNYTAVGGLFNSIKSSLTGIADLDKELHQFQAISAATNSEMAVFKKNLIEISQSVPFTTLEITQAATALAQAGLSTQQVTESLGSIAMFATATGSSLTQAVDVVTSTLTAFNLETSRTGDVANIFTAALNLSKLSVDKLQTSLNYIGPTAEALGLTLEETTSILGALSQSGVKASTMGTGFRALLTDLQSPSKKLTENLKAAGLTIEDINVKTKGFLPVIETLKNAGFGAAEAYESLETRSAAAFLALANNTQLAYDMQKSFVLSAAAVEANATQMKSLSNTAQTLGNTIGSAVFTAFEPVVATLQQILAGATSVLGYLNQFPAVLNTIAVAASILATVMGVSLIGALIRSFSTMIPIIGTFVAGMAAVGPASVGAAAGVGLLTRVIAGLSAVLASNWLGLLIAGITLAAGAFFAWRGRTDELTTSIDKLETKVNDLKGAADATESKINSLETAIQGLIDRRDELDKNELMRGAKIDELRAQFQELGLSIKDDTASVTDLIRELNDLKQTSSRVRAAELAEAGEARRGEIDLLGKQREKLTNRNGVSANFIRGLADQAVGGAGGAVETSSNDYLVDAVGKKLGTNIGEALRIALGDLSQVRDAREAISLGKYVNEQIGVLERKGDPNGDLGFLQELKATIDPIVSNLAKSAAAEADLTTILRRQADATITGSDAFKNLTGKSQWIQSTFNSKMTDISTGNLTDEQKIEAFSSVRRWLETVKDKSINSFNEEFAREAQTDPNLAGVDPQAVSAQIGQTLNKLQLSLNEQSMKAVAAQSKAVTKEVKKAEQTQNRELGRWQRQINGARNTDAFEAAKKGYEEFRKASTQQIVDFYDELIRLATTRKDNEEVERLQGERQDFMDRATAELEEQNRDNDKKEQDLLKDSLQRQREAIQDIAKGIQKQIDLSLDELKRTPPSAAMDALVQKIKDLNSQLNGELNKIGNIDVQLGGIDLDTPISQAVAGSAQAAIKHYMDRGFSKAGAAAIAGNLNIESGFDPNALGDKGTAHGAAQWRGTRWNELRSFAIGRGAASNDLPTQYDFVIKELQRDYPDLFQRLKAGDEDVDTLTRDFMNIFERPNKDPAKNHIGRRLASSRSFFNTDASATQGQLDQNDQNLQQAIDDNNAQQIKAMSDATIKNLKSRITNLKTQVRFTDDATSLKDLQKQIQDAHAQMMDAELKKFDAENVDLQKANPTDFSTKRQEMIDGLRENLNSDIQKVMEEYFKAAEEELNRPVDAAKAKLDAAQQPDMASKSTQVDLQNLQQNVVDREREAAVNRILLIEQQIAEVRRMASDAEKTYGAGSTEALQWRTLENDLIQKNNTLKEQNNALDAVKAQQAPSVSSAISSATQAWAQQNGIIDAAGKMIPLAKQMESTWGGVLDGLSSGFSQFFMNISSGTMSAGDAFKQLGQTILQMFMQIIAKALANQIIMSLFGGGGGGSGIFGALGQGLFGVVGGKALGGLIRAANGTIAPFRDGGAYQLMPGEMVLRQSAVQMIGEDKLTEMNNLGNRQISEGALAGRAANDNLGQQGVVNVWVVSPDQVPQQGPNDIIATVADNIQRRGTLKKLIQQVQMGG
ncbi:phage tail tape measure protein [Rhizobium ruizarguesonis]|uniref:phage tail tape measure protein n=1 Tax=Rhizobium ruizarguesonis TaxID=2081791 RepID=UPI00163AEB46|nr:phage tail tape measure protein [Rhizobium ruizarguesonis]MBC2806546.1 phage tail tape measure protein [Rhizobium ruizarguesonis]